MLTRKNKEEIVKKLTDKLRLSKSVVFADFKGLKISDSFRLKRELKKEGSNLEVIKKSLISIALKNAKIDLDVRKMEGQVAVSISEQDEITPAKVLDKFSKDNENLKILGGILGDKVMSTDEVKALAKLPGKNELLAKLVGTLNAPISGFANVLAGNLRGLVQVLKAVGEQKA